ncbi:hypothetical protein AMECASPLE_018524 [Ameca splendens]|uniref:Uncharacterized protein n=1 Tax=Ameca splendens TaxID=208324 RepID=A0ABV0Z2D6_9TELE
MSEFPSLEKMGEQQIPNVSLSVSAVIGLIFSGFPQRPLSVLIARNSSNLIRNNTIQCGTTQQNNSTNNKDQEPHYLRVTFLRTVGTHILSLKQTQTKLHPTNA